MDLLQRDKPGRMGIDAGASLWKLVLLPEDQRGDLEMEYFPAGTVDAMEEVRRRIAAWSPGQVQVTGGGAGRVAAALAGTLVRQVSEFAAWARGAQVLAGRAGWSLPQRYLLVSVGTGTSILDVEGETFQRIGGTALGGGTLLGLARLLCGAESFAEAVALAARGERGRVDLLVRDVYPEGGIALPPDLTASNFAKLASREPADLAHALLGLLGENIGLLATAVAYARGIDTLVFGGSALDGNPTLQEILRQTVQMGGREARILPHGGFCGAVGAAAAPHTPQPHPTLMR
jgi:type II pantothenate kinase